MGSRRHLVTFLGLVWGCLEGAPGGATPLVAKSTKPSTAAAAQPPPEIAESTRIEPELIYRLASLTPVEESVYHDPKHKDFADQLYVILHFARTYNYTHEVVVEPALRTIRNNPASWDKEHVAEQAYVESTVRPWLTLTAGKKAEFEGSGFFINPADLLNETKDAFDPLYQKEGEFFARLRARQGDYVVGLGFIPARGRDGKEGKAWLTLGAVVREVDLKLQSTHHESEKTTVGVSAQRFFGGAFELHTDSRYQTRQREQRADNVGPTVFSAYSGEDVETSRDDDPSGFYLVGSRYVFTHQRTLVVESIQNQSGLLPADFERYFAVLRSERAESQIRTPPTTILGRHYVFLGYQEDGLLKSTHLSVNALQNTDDKSAFVALIARYHLSPITSVELAPTFFKGAANTEFGEMPFASATYLVFKGRF